MKRLWAFLGLALMVSLINYPVQAIAEEMNIAEAMSIKDGSQVAFDYTLTVEGKVIDSSTGAKPLEYTHGQGQIQIIPGLSRELEGMRVGEAKLVTVLPEDAYGLVDPKAFQEIPKTDLPPNLEPQVGMLLQARDPQGRPMSVKISEVKPETVIMDFNHPLAGKTLNFQVKIVSIK